MARQAAVQFNATAAVAQSRWRTIAFDKMAQELIRGCAEIYSATSEALVVPVVRPCSTASVRRDRLRSPLIRSVSVRCGS